MKSRETILEELKEISPLLAGIDPINPYSVPNFYFEELEGKVKKAILAHNGLSRVETAQEYSSAAVSAPDELPGILAELKASKSMTVPEGYFDSFASSVLQKIKEEKSTPVIKMAPQRKVFLQWAAAAITIGIIILTVFLYRGNQQTDNNLVNTNTEIENFSIETLESFVEGQTIAFNPAVVSTSSDLKAEDMRAVMGDISEEALQLYLNTHSGNLETQVN